MARFWGGRLRFVVVAYVALYILLDWASLIDRSSPLGITPWNPPAGLSFALLLRFGFGFTPAVFGAVVLSDLMFRDVGAAPWALVASAAVIAVGYGAAAVLLRHMQIALALERRNDLIALLGIALAAATVIALAVIAVFCTSGLLPWSDYTEIALRFWVGDVLGIVVLTPFLLLLLVGRRRWPALARPSAAIEYGLQLAAIGLGLWIIFGLESANHFEFSYILFLPLIWIALRDGLIGAAWGIVATQIGIIVAIQVKGFDADTVTQFQFLMLAVAVTGFFLGSVVDERQRAESNLRDSEARLQTVVSTAPDAILTFEEGGRITSANRAAAEMFGAGQRALTGSPLQKVLPQIGAGTALRAGTETTAQRTDGNAFTAEVSVGRADLAGRTLHVAVVRDITERKQAEAAMQQHEMQLAHAARLTAAGEMAAGLAHELNQPLAAAISFARACEEVLKAPPEKAAEARGQAVELIGETVQQALCAGEIIRRTREFLRRGDLRPRAIGIAELFKLTLDLVRTELSLQRVAVTTAIAPGLPPVFVDAIQIEQVILNLLRNSMEEMSRAGGSRQIVLSAGPAADRMVEIAVADSGPGIPPELADRLFTPFATTKEGGMGLGLSISRSIIEAHGGQIRAVAKEAGAGAEIRFTLPAYSESEEAGDED